MLLIGCLVGQALVCGVVIFELLIRRPTADEIVRQFAAPAFMALGWLCLAAAVLLFQRRVV